MRSLSEETESPTVERAEFPLTTFAAHSFLPQMVVAQALFRQYREDYGEQGDQGTLVEKPNGVGNIRWRSSVDNWNDKGFAWGNGVVEGEVDCSLTVRELRTGADGNSRADNRKQNRLVRDQVR